MLVDFDSHRPECPCLSSSAVWDDPSALRGELYAAEHLTLHAAEVARAHGAPSLRITPGPLRKRFAAARKRIRVAYEILASGQEEHHDPTPAEEWLLDNSHVVNEQIREIQDHLPWRYLVELPRVSHGAMRGYPRVYGLCLDYLRHTDARVDPTSLADYVSSYQRVSGLTIGELWAVPIMLRLGLTLVVGALAVSESNTKDRRLADELAEKLVASAESGDDPQKHLFKMSRSTVVSSDAFLVQLVRRVRESDAPLTVVSEWVQERCDALGTTLDDLARKQHLRRAADQVSVGNAITSMRAIAALDWTRFFELTSTVDAVLRRDPACAYSTMDLPSQDRCRHAVERLSRRGRLSELDVAEAALTYAQGASKNPGFRESESHVGHYLLGDGMRQLEHLCGYRARLRERWTRLVLSFPLAFYLTAFLGLLLPSCYVAALILLPLTPNIGVCLVLVCLFALPASEVILAFVNALAVFTLPPRLLPKLDFKHGIPDAHRTLVVVPSLLENQASLAQLLEDLEVRSLGNPGKNLYFALLTDFLDSDADEVASDLELLDQAVQGIAELNRRLAGAQPRYFLFHRRRSFNPSEKTFMGWERKRGKLEELNALLRGATDTSFTVVTAPLALLTTIQYVITLDADTELMRDAARRLVGTMAHPQNRPVVDLARRRVVSGHGIIQPRVGTLPISAHRSRFARILSGQPGIDPYTTAVSDLYQDLFGEGSFIGKGIYDVDAFSIVLRERIPDNRMLSHDLFEGCIARSALATDIEVLDEQPATYGVASGREHRWVRGDWQLLPWLMPCVRERGGVRRLNDLRPLDRWKLLDNLRRSLVAPSLVLLLVLSWLLAPTLVPMATLTLLCVFAGPVLSRQVLALTRAAFLQNSQVAGFGGELVKSLLQLLLRLLLVLDQALLSVDAIVRTVHRLVVSNKRLLEWTTMSQAARLHSANGARTSRRFALSAWAAALALPAVTATAPSALPFAAPLLGLWMFAPAVVGWMGRPANVRRQTDQLPASARRELRLVALKTWRFFDRFVTSEDNWLPPDNYQHEPRGVVAHRTSPTNIGLYLLSVVAARDFAFITVSDVLTRLENTLATLARMERRSGHVLNWYDTTTLHPLEPQYVSTVDSGNLAAYLWTLREACRELSSTPLFDAATFQAALDALWLSVESQGPARTEPSSELPTELIEFEGALTRAFAAGTQGAVERLRELQAVVATASAAMLSGYAQRCASDSHYWLHQSLLILTRAASQIGELAPCLEHLSTPPARLRDGRRAEHFEDMLRCFHDSQSFTDFGFAATECIKVGWRLECELDSITDTDERAACTEYLQQLRSHLENTTIACDALETRALKIGEDSVGIADGMDFGFLYDSERSLFSIGYNLGGARLDASHYDLLASEARLASLIAISKGDAPLEHWSMLARPRTSTSSGRALMSWSGSMFEYLMPLLLTGLSRDTLLWETCHAAIGHQQAYGAQREVPWGISEAAYNVMDLGMTYQYRAFGVPSLGLKSGLGEHLVVAPYATALAAMLRPKQALDNFRA
ncbi:MAG: hypothetical protein RJA70_2601, partial [Pseudomonadota bacterium]